MPAYLLPAKQLKDEQILEYLWEILPALYKVAGKTHMHTEDDVERLRKFLKSVDAKMSELRYLIDFMIEWLDPWVCPYSILPYLAPIVGVDFNYDIPEDYARREIAAAIYLWQHKGTIESIKNVTRLFLDTSCTVREYAWDVMRSNVYGQAYSDLTLPQEMQYHCTNTWDGSEQVPSKDGECFGSHNGSHLYRNHIGVYIEISEKLINNLWYGTPYFDYLIRKFYKILNRVMFYGVEPHVIWTMFFQDSYDIVQNFEVNNERWYFNIDRGLDDITTVLDYRNVLFSNNFIAWPWSLEINTYPLYMYSNSDYATMGAASPTDEFQGVSIMGIGEAYEDVLEFPGIDFIQNEEPNCDSEGLLWYQPKTGLLYWCHDGSWVALDYFTSLEPQGASQGELWYKV